jgi:hypothetical protein
VRERGEIILETDEKEKKFYENLSTLTQLTTSWHFNQQVSHFSANLTHLTASKCFNQPISSLSSKLTHLFIIEINFNQ